MAVGEADPGAGLLDLRHAVVPGPLGLATCHEKVPSPEHVSDGPPTSFRAKEELAGETQRDEHHDRLFYLLEDPVPVPGHAVPPIPIEVEADGIELDGVTSGQSHSHVLEDRWFQWVTGPDVPGGGETRLDHTVLVHPPRPLTPVPELEDLTEEVVRA